MCLIVFSYKIHPEFDLILGANRDEFFDRPTQVLSFWDDASDILAGRDLKNKGTWLGVTKTGRIAAVTNYRDPASSKDNAVSRGVLVSDFLAGRLSPVDYLEQVKKCAYNYNCFNLLAGDRSGLFYYSNKTTHIQNLKPGLYGLSNRLLDVPWPKVEKAKTGLKNILCSNRAVCIERIFNILYDRAMPSDEKLPDTGIGIDGERILGPVFVKMKGYGTRSSSVVLIEANGTVTFSERTFKESSQKEGDCDIVTLSFQINEGK